VASARLAECGFGSDSRSRSDAACTYAADGRRSSSTVMRRNGPDYLKRAATPAAQISYGRAPTIPALEQICPGQGGM